MGAKFKEVGLLGGSLFLDAKKLGLVEENDPASLVDLNIDRSYFNLLKGLTCEQIFPHLHKRLKFPEKEQNRNMVRDLSIENYIYLQENFRKIGRFEDADLIYFQRKVLEAEKETDGWKRTWNWILDSTCKYGTDFKQVVYVSLWVIVIFTGLYFLTICPALQTHIGTIEIKDKDQWIEKEKLRHVFRSQGVGKLIIAIFKHLWHAFYLSVNTFTTVGTGDIIATRLFRVFVLIEGALGWFMLGLFIVVFSAKFLR